MLLLIRYTKKERCVLFTIVCPGTCACCWHLCSACVCVATQAPVCVATQAAGGFLLLLTYLLPAAGVLRARVDTKANI